MNIIPKNTKMIPLSKGKFAIVDEEDFEKINKSKWFAYKKNSRDGYYATRNTKHNNKKTSEQMHRFILGLKKYDGVMVDHIDRNGLNNTKKNLRICSHVENCNNREKQKNNTSGFKGVQKHKKNGKWRVAIAINRRPKHLGYFDTIKEAVRAYKIASLMYHGEFSIFYRRSI